MDNSRVRLYRCCLLLLLIIWLFLAYGVGIGMTLTGVFQTGNQCLFNSQYIVIYLIVAGVATLIWLMMRFCLCTCQVCVSCYRDNIPGTCCAFTVCGFELLSCVFVLFLIVWMAAGIYFILAVDPQPDRQDPLSPNYCSDTVYIPAVTFLVAQMVLIPCSFITCSTICCGAKVCCCVEDPEDELPPPRRKQKDDVEVAAPKERSEEPAAIFFLRSKLNNNCL